MLNNVCLIVIGMSGTGKTTLIGVLCLWFSVYNLKHGALFIQSTSIQLCIQYPMCLLLIFEQLTNTKKCL